MKRKSIFILTLLVALIAAAFTLSACAGGANTVLPDYSFDNGPTVSDEDRPGDIVGDALDGYGKKSYGWVYDREAGTVFSGGGNRRIYYKAAPALDYIFSADITFGAYKNDDWPRAGFVAAQSLSQSVNPMFAYPSGGAADLHIDLGSTSNVSVNSGATVPTAFSQTLTSELTVVRKGGNFFYFVDGEYVAYDFIAHFETNPGVPGFHMWGCETTYSDIEYSTDADKIAGMIDSACAKVDIGYYEHGTVTVRSDYSQYLPVEQSVNVYFTAEDGYLLTGLKINGRESFYKVSRNEKGETVCNIPRVGKTLSIEPVFEKVPSVLHTVSGTLSFETGAVVPASLYAMRGTYYREITLTEDNGKYIFTAELPEGEDYVFVAGSVGFMNEYYEVDVIGDLDDVDIVLRAVIFGGSPGYAVLGDWNTLEASKGNLSNSTNEYSRIFLPELYGSKQFYLRANVYVLNLRGGEVRTGFYFAYTDGAGTHETMPTIRRENGSYQFQVVGDYGVTKNLTPDLVDKLTDDEVGLNMELYRDGKNLRMYVDGALYKEYNNISVDVDWTVGFAAWASTKFSDIYFVNGAAAAAELDKINVSVKQLSGGGSYTIVSSPAAIGDELTVRFTPEAGSYISEFIVNGTDMYRLIDEDEFTYTVTADRRFYDVRVAYSEMGEGEFTYSGSVRFHKHGSYTNEATDVTFYGGGETVSVTSDADGKFSAKLKNRRYLMVIEKPGYVETIVDMFVSSDVVGGEFIVEYDIIKAEGGYGAWDLSGQNEGSVSVSGGYAFARFSEISEDEKYFAVSVNVYAPESTVDDSSRRVGIAFNRSLENAAEYGGKANYDLTVYQDGISVTQAAGWTRKDMAAAYVEAYHSEDGLKLTLIREGDTLYMFAGGQLYETFTLAENIPSLVGLAAWYGTEFTDYEISCGQEAVSAAKKVVFRGETDLEHGTWTVDGVKSLGDPAVISFVPDEGYELSFVKINGADMTYKVMANELVFDSIGYIELNVEVAFKEKHVSSESYSYSGTVKLHRNGKTVNGEGAVITLSDVNGRQTVVADADGAFEFSAPAKSYYVSVEMDGYVAIEKQIELVSDISGDDMILEYDLLEKVDGWLNWDLSRQNDGIVTVSPAEGYGWVRFKNIAEDEQNFVISAFVSSKNVLTPDTRYGLAFNRDDKNGNEYGVTINESGNFSVTGDGGGGGWTNDPLSEKNKSALNSDGGLKLTFIRKGTTLYCIAGDELMRTYTIDASVPSAPGLAAWSGMTYTRVYSDTGLDAVNDALEVAFTGERQPEGGSWSVSGKSYLGDSAVISFLPDTDWYLSALTVNGQDMYGAVNDNELVLTGLKYSYYEIDAVFSREDTTEYKYSGVVNGHKDGKVTPLSGAVVKMIGGSVNEQVTTNADGSFELTLRTRTYSLSIEKDGYVSVAKSVELAGDVSENHTLEYDLLVGTVNADKWDLSRQNDGEVSLSEGPDGIYGVALFKNIAEDEQNFVISAFVSSKDLTSSGFRYGLAFNRDDKNGNEYGVTINESGNFSVTGDGGGGWTNDPLSAANKAALNSDKGLRLMLIRKGTTLYCIAGDELVKTYNIKVSTPSAAGLVSWCGITYTGVYAASGIDAVNSALAVEFTGEREVDGGSWTAVGDNMLLGGSAAIEFTPDSGYVVSSVKINGADAFGMLDGNTIVIETLDKLTMNIEVAFAEAATEEFTYSGVVSGKRNGRTQPLGGVTVTLTGGDVTETAVTDDEGKYTVTTVSRTYAVSIAKAGYITVNKSLELTGDALENHTLEFDLIAGGNNLDISRQNDGTVSFGGGYARNAVKAVPADSKYFVVEANIKFNAPGADQRIGFALNKEDNSAFSYRPNIKVEAAENGVVTSARLEMQDVWHGYALTPEQCAALTDGGVKLALVRAGDRLDICVDGVAALTYRLAEGTLSNVDIETWANGVYSDLKVNSYLSADEADGDAAHTLSGTVSVLGGGDVSGAEVAVKTLAGADVGSVTLASDGSYSIAGVPAGGYVVVSAVKDGFIAEERVIGVTEDTALDLVLASFRWKDASSLPVEFTDGGRTVAFNLEGQNWPALAMDVLADDFTVTAKIKYVSNHEDDYAGVGFRFTTSGDGKFETLIRRDGNDDAFSCRSYSTSGETALSSEQIARLKDEGIEFKVVRRGNVFSTYIDGAETAVHTWTAPSARITEIALMSWCASAVYSDVTLTVE